MGRTLQESIRRQDELHWEQTRQGDADVFRCAGAFSLVSHEQLAEIGALAKTTDARRIVMDMREVAHMDSAGLGTLAMIVKHMMLTSRKVVVIPSGQVRNLIASTGIDRVVLLADSIPAALAANSEPS